jgi:hypothetical protein
MSLILVFNKNSPRAHTESELGVLGVHGKLVKYVGDAGDGFEYAQSASRY